MPHAFGELTWEDVAALDRSRAVPILPVGATEAHGPHLPLETDVIIAMAMARAAASELERAGRVVLLLPPLAYVAAPFASGFAGTISIAPELITRLVAGIAGSLGGQGFRCLAIANAHLDPAHLASLHAAAEGAAIPLIFPDLTRRALAARLGAEFQSGACHAGQFEGSVVLAERPHLVRDERRRSLPPNPVSLVTAIRSGKERFEEAGGPLAYFGDPAAASAEEGRHTIRELGAILAQAVDASLTSMERPTA